MNEMERYELGNAGLNYIKTMVAQGRNLGRNILELCDLSNGCVFTYLPEGIDRRSLEEFKCGGKLRESHDDQLVKEKNNSDQIKKFLTPNLDKIFASYIESIIENQKNSISIFENVVAKGSDPYIKSLKTPYWIYNDSVYHYFLKQDKGFLSGLELLRSATNAYFIWGIVASWDYKDDLIAGTRELRKEDLEDFAKNTESILVSAYDGESFVIWEKYK